MRGEKTYERVRRLGEHGNIEWDPMSLLKKRMGEFYVVDEKFMDEMDVENERIPVDKV